VRYPVVRALYIQSETISVEESNSITPTAIFVTDGARSDADSLF